MEERKIKFRKNLRNNVISTNKYLYKLYYITF